MTGSSAVSILCGDDNDEIGVTLEQINGTELRNVPPLRSTLGSGGGHVNRALSRPSRSAAPVARITPQNAGARVM